MRKFEPKNVRINEIDMLHCLAMRRTMFEAKNVNISVVVGLVGRLRLMHPN
jgi:hypothetical protein